VPRPTVSVQSIAEAADVKEKGKKTSEGVRLTTASVIVSRHNSKAGVRKRSMRWVQWEKRKKDSQLVRAAVGV